jgi:hypothetical protein
MCGANNRVVGIFEADEWCRLLHPRCQTLSATSVPSTWPFLTNDNFDAMHISLQLTADLQGSLGQNGDPPAQYGQIVADDRCCQRCLGRWWTNGRGGRWLHCLSTARFTRKGPINGHGVLYATRVLLKTRYNGSFVFARSHNLSRDHLAGLALSTRAALMGAINCFNSIRPLI